MNYSKSILSSIVILLSLSLMCFASSLEVEIPPIINGVTFFTNYSFANDTNIMKSEMYWENMGSVACLKKYRLDYYNAGINYTKKIIINNKTYIDTLAEENQVKILHSSYSSELIYAGGRKSIYNYFIPSLNSSVNENTYSVQPRVYGCNEVIYLEPYEISVGLSNVSFDNDVDLKIVNAWNDKNDIQFSIVSSKNTEVVIIPYEKPFWYEVSSKKIALKKNKINTISLPFFADDFMTNQRKISFVFASPDLKKIYAMETIQLKYPEDEEMSFFAFVFVGLIFLVAQQYLMGMFWKKKKEIVKKSKKKLS